MAQERAKLAACRHNIERVIAQFIESLNDTLEFAPPHIPETFYIHVQVHIEEKGESGQTRGEYDFERRAAKRVD